MITYIYIYINLHIYIYIEKKNYAVKPRDAVLNDRRSINKSIPYPTRLSQYISLFSFMCIDFAPRVAAGKSDRH